MLHNPCPWLNFPIRMELLDYFWEECLKSVLKVSESVSYICPLTRFQALSKADFLTAFPSLGEENWVNDHRTVLLISFGSSFKEIEPYPGSSTNSVPLDSTASLLKYSQELNITFSCLIPWAMYFEWGVICFLGFFSLVI